MKSTTSKLLPCSSKDNDSVDVSALNKGHKLLIGGGDMRLTGIAVERMISSALQGFEYSVLEWYITVMVET